MTERLVSMVEPQLHRRVVAAAIGLGFLVRLLFGYEPVLIFVALLFPFLGMFFLRQHLAQSERVPLRERTRLYRSVFPYWERVLLPGLGYGVGFGLLRADRVDTLPDLVTAVLFFAVAGLVFGLALEIIWSMSA